ncbi:MAG: hypothetical protein ACRD21_25300, partial [Vicinamibacteria bacterium]
LLSSGHEKVYRVKSPDLDRASFRHDLERLRELVSSREREKALRLLKRMVNPDDILMKDKSPGENFSISEKESA